MVNIFQGKLVRLRAVEPADWSVHFVWDQDVEVGRLTDEIWYPTSALQTQAWAQKEATRGPENDAFHFQIETLTGELIGTINTHTAHPRNGTFRYGLAIRPEYRRKGYATEAIGLVLRYYFDERRYQKVNADVYSFNQPSIRLHERLNFVLEGRLRRMIFSQGQFHDVLVFGLTREEFATAHWKPTDESPNLS